MPLHYRRTLDQYGYPSLRDTSLRDGDQVLFKRTRDEKDPRKESIIKSRLRSGLSSVIHPTESGEVEDAAAKVLMVDQLWLWILNDQTVVTFAASKEPEQNDGGDSKQGDFCGNLDEEIRGKRAKGCVEPFEFAALAVFHAVKALLDHTSDPNLQVFRIFEEYISIMTEQQTTSFKGFRNNHRSRGNDFQELPEYLDNRANLDALLELRDIEDELSMLNRLFKEQR